MCNQANAFGAGAHGDGLRLEDSADRLRDVLVLARHESRLHLDDRHLAAEAPVHLPEFKADIAAADDNEMLGKPVESEKRAIRQVRHLVDAGQRRYDGTSADIDKDARPRQHLVADRNSIGRDKPRVALKYRATFHVAERALDAAAG